MAKTILYRLFKLGRMPKDYRAALESEGLVLFDEGISGTVTFRRFRAPGRRYSWRKNWFSGSIALTRKRVIAFTFFREIINVPLDDAWLAKLKCEAEDDTCLYFSFEAGDFNSDMSGTVEVRFKTSHAKLFAEKVRAERG